MRIKVLGSAAGGGFPQWNCICSNCSALRAGTLKSRPRTQAQVAVSPDPSRWFLLNASPDLRQQILSTPELNPASDARGTPISTVLLTSANLTNRAANNNFEAGLLFKGGELAERLSRHIDDLRASGTLQAVE